MEILYLLLVIQGVMGAFDTLYHHEIKVMLPWTSGASLELKIHGIRNLFYSFIFVSLGLGEWHGLLAILFALVIVLEILLTLWDFIIEDMTRQLPQSERITHTLLAINYGAILMLLAPLLWRWSHSSIGFETVYHPIFSPLLIFFGFAVLLWAIRDGLAGMATQRRQNTVDEARAARVSITKRSIPPRSYLVTGGSGFIGRDLCQQLIDQGHQVTVVTRNFGKTAAQFSGQITLLDNVAQLSDCAEIDVIINLAGEPIADSRWDSSSKALMIQSRVLITQSIIDFIARAEHKPSVLVSGSAIGFYGLRQDERLTEQDEGVDCFSHQLCKAWEEAAGKASQFGVRVCLLRTGLVLGLHGGPLAKMILPFQFGLGGRVGHGRQWMSWIHRDDLINMILHAVDNDALNGPINGVSPNPVTNQGFTKSLAKALKRPAIFPVPTFLLRILLGEMADELLLAGQRVIPEKASGSGFEFSYPHLDKALKQIIYPC